MGYKVAQIIVSNRMVTAENLNGTSLNLRSIKRRTGHNTIAVPPLSTVARCTVDAASNIAS